VYSEKVRFFAGAHYKGIKGRIAIMRKAILLLTAILALGSIAYPQSPAIEKPREVQAGEVIPIGESLFVKVARSTRPFDGVKVKGEAVVVTLEMDSGKAGATLFYNLSADPKSTEIYLLSGAKKLAPQAVIEDFPSWGTDNDKEVEVLDPKDALGGTTLNFERKGSINLLFDVPVEDSKVVKKLSVALRMVQPKDQQRSFIVSL
jgi:hypothetical protein